MRPRVLVAAVATLAVPSSAVQGAGPSGTLGAHWDVAPSGRDGRRAAVLILDATGAPRVLEALRVFKARWNAMRETPPLAVLPAVDVGVGAPAACTAEGLRAVPGAAAHVVVCLQDQLGNAAVGGPYLVDARRHTRLGLVKMRRSTLSWTPCNLQTAVAHEIGHVMGLAHNDVEAFAGGPSLMMSGNGPYRHGCPVWFNAHDRAALAALYRDHVAEAVTTRTAGQQARVTAAGPGPAPRPPAAP